MALYLPVLLGTARDGNHTKHVARWIADQVDARQGFESRCFEPADLPFGDLQRREWEMDPQPEAVATFVEEMARADGFVLCTPEYNHGYPGALKNVLDHLYDEWNRKPFALATTGGMSGGIRAGELLRVVIGGLGGVPVPRALHVQRARDAFGPDGPDDLETWEPRLGDLLEDLGWYAEALTAARGRTD